MSTSPSFLSNAANNMTTDDTLHCTLFNHNQHLCNVIVAVKKTTASLSLIGCIFMIFIIWVYKRYAVFVQRLIMYLSIAALLDSIFYVMGDLHSDGTTCDFQAWGLTYFEWSVLLWVCIITFNLYWNAIYMKPTDHFEWIYHAVAWLVPFFISLLPFIGDHYGPAELWCWIVDDWVWRFGIWYCPLFLIIIAMFAAYLYIFITVNKKMKTWEGMYDPDVERSKQVLKEDVKPLRAYPFVYLALYIFPLINRMQNAIGPEPIFILMLLQAMTSPLQGAVNAIVFGMDKETTSRLTWGQLKMAFMSRFHSSDSAIREFSPTPPDLPVTNDMEIRHITPISRGVVNSYQQS